MIPETKPPYTLAEHLRDTMRLMDETVAGLRGPWTEFTIPWNGGLDDGPAAMIACLTQHFLPTNGSRTVEITNGDHTVSAYKIMEVLSLAAGVGSRLMFLARGIPEAEALPYLQAVERLMCTKEPEHEIHEGNAAERFGFSQELVELLRHSTQNIAQPIEL